MKQILTVLLLVFALSVKAQNDTIKNYLLVAEGKLSTPIKFDSLQETEISLKFYNSSADINIAKGIKVSDVIGERPENDDFFYLDISVDTAELLKQGWKLPDQKKLNAPFTFCNDSFIDNVDIGFSNNNPKSPYGNLDMDGEAIVTKPNSIDGADYNAIYRHNRYEKARERFDTIPAILLISDTCRKVISYWVPGNITRRWGFPVTGFYTDEYSSGGTTTYPGLTEYVTGYLDNNKKLFSKCIVVWIEKH